LAAALNDDPNFSTTIMTLLSNRVEKETGKSLISIAEWETVKSTLQTLNATVTSDNTLAKFSDLTYQTAQGTANAIILILPPLQNGYPVNFIAAYNNEGLSTTINDIKLYKPNSTNPTKLIAGKAYTTWYDLNKNCFFLQASAEGNTIKSHVLAGDIYSTDEDTGLVGEMPDNGAVIITPDIITKSIPLGYHPGTGYVPGEPNLISDNIKANKSIFGVTGKSSVVDTSDALATAAQLLLNVSAYVNGNKIIGSMPNNGAVTITPGTTNKSIPLGYHPGTGYVPGEPNLISDNIKANKSIFGISGKASVVDTTDASVAASQMITGTTAYKNGTKITGTMPYVSPDISTHKNAVNISAGIFSGDGANYAYTQVHNGNYLNGIDWYRSYQPYLLAQYILSGANIFGVAGSATIQNLGGYQATWGSGTIPGSGSYTVNTGGVQPKFILCRISSFIYVYSASFPTASGYRLDNTTWYSETTNANYKITLTSTGFIVGNFSAASSPLVYTAFY
jgi:hypothetical protein